MTSANNFEFDLREVRENPAPLKVPRRETGVQQSMQRAPGRHDDPGLIGARCHFEEVIRRRPRKNAQNASKRAGTARRPLDTLR